MTRKAMEKQARKLLGYVKEADFEGVLWAIRQYAAEGMNEEAGKAETAQA